MVYILKRSLTERDFQHDHMRSVDLPSKTAGNCILKKSHLKSLEMF